MNLVVLGLRRSGTTAFWRVFRQDPRLLGFNEPFNPLLRCLPEDRAGGTWREFVELWKADPARFWEVYAPISGLDEIRPELSSRQRAYLRALAEDDRPLLIDETRMHFKLEALKETLPDTLVVHLHRSPEAVATSHLVPSLGKDVRARARRARLRLDFWSRRSRYNYWGVESLVGNDPRSPFGHRLEEAGMDAEAIYALPAVGRMLAYWKLNTERLDADGPKHFGDAFMSVAFADFCADPQATVDEVYGRLGLPVPELDLSFVHPAKPPRDAGGARWRRLKADVGLDPGIWD